MYTRPWGRRKKEYDGGGRKKKRERQGNVERKGEDRKACKCKFLRQVQHTKNIRQTLSIYNILSYNTHDTHTHTQLYRAYNFVFEYVSG
jgi:hypothetical protein